MRALVAALHTEEGERLRRFFSRRLRERQDVADAIQDTFLRLLSRNAAAEILEPRAYLMRVAKTVLHRRYTDTAADAALFAPPEAGEGVATDQASPEHTVIIRQRLLLLIQAIRQLPPRCQEVFALSRLEGMSNGDIAAKLGISRNMVEKHIIRALLQCRAVSAVLS